MDKGKSIEPVPRTVVERTSDTELLITHSFDAPAPLVFAAWTRPELMRQWWIPKSTGMTLVTCEMDVRVGGRYRFEIRHPAVDHLLAFFGRYFDVVPDARLVWTNEESDAGAVTTVTFAERDGKTALMLHEIYPSKRALDESFEGMEGGMPTQLDQLDGLLAAGLA